MLDQDRNVIFNAIPLDTVNFLRKHPEHNVPGNVVIDGLSLRPCTIDEYLERYKDK